MRIASEKVPAPETVFTVQYNLTKNSLQGTWELADKMIEKKYNYEVPDHAAQVVLNSSEHEKGGLASFEHLASGADAFGKFFPHCFNVGGWIKRDLQLLGL